MCILSQMNDFIEKCEAASRCCIHMKVEFVAGFEATFQANWLQNIISGLGVVNIIARSLKTYCDNSVAVFFSKNDKYYKGVKLMKLKYFVVKEEVQKHKSANRTCQHQSYDC